MAASQVMFLLDASLHGLRALVCDATTTHSWAFGLVFVCFLICILKISEHRTGLADTKFTTWAQSIGLLKYILCVLSSPRLRLSLERFAFAGFWFICFYMIPPSQAVNCVTCKDNISPAHNTAACPLSAGVVANVAALGAASTALVAISQLLPVKFVRVLPRAVLDSLKGLVNRPSGAFDYTGKSINEVFEAAVHGHTTVDEAQVWLHTSLLAAASNIEVTKIKGTMGCSQGHWRVSLRDGEKYIGRTSVPLGTYSSLRFRWGFCTPSFQAGGGVDFFRFFVLCQAGPSGDTG